MRRKLKTLGRKAFHATVAISTVICGLLIFLPVGLAVMLYQFLEADKEENNGKAQD